jgi:hypothetical protein
MSPENHEVFQVLKEVTFQRILTFCNSWIWGNLGVSVRDFMRSGWLVGLVSLFICLSAASEILEPSRA